MKLADLVNEAREKNSLFNQSMHHRLNRTTPKPPDLPWLMKKLEEILGREYVLKAAQEEVDKMKEAAKAPADGLK